MERLKILKSMEKVTYFLKMDKSLLVNFKMVVSQEKDNISSINSV